MIDLPEARGTARTLGMMLPTPPGTRMNVDESATDMICKNPDLPFCSNNSLRAGIVPKSKESRVLHHSLMIARVCDGNALAAIDGG